MNHDDNNLNDIVHSGPGEMVETDEDMGFGADGFDGDDFGGDEPVKKSINSGALIILVVVVIREF